MKATNIKLLWDRDATDPGYFVRITREDGQRIDSLPPEAGDWIEPEIANSEARDMIEAALEYEGLEADNDLIEEAIDNRDRP